MGSIEPPQSSAITIPIIDVSSFLSGDPKASTKAAAELRSACENQGFLQVIGHAVPGSTQKKFLEAIAAFFKLPLDEKLKISQDNSPCHRGYERIGGQKLDELDEDATPDQKEGFSIRPARPLGKFLAGPNQWPDESVLPGFKETYMEYFDAVHSLSKSMFQLMALSLGLDRTYFDSFAADPDGALHFTCYFSLLPLPLFLSSLFPLSISKYRSLPLLLSTFPSNTQFHN
jgi:isopenicillin N synthase-like dioxygenase